MVDKQLILFYLISGFRGSLRAWILCPWINYKPFNPWWYMGIDPGSITTILYYFYVFGRRWVFFLYRIFLNPCIHGIC